MQVHRTDHRLTYDDLLLLPDDRMRHEIIDGEHYVTPAPNFLHQRLVGRLYARFMEYLKEQPGAGEAFLAPFDVVFTKHDVVEPDLLFLSADQRDIVTIKTGVQGPPALVIEVLSPGTRRTDKNAKRRLFERGGVGEYWMVDPDAQRIRVCRRLADLSFPLVADLGGDRGDTLTTPLLPGFSMALDDLFLDLDVPPGRGRLWPRRKR